MKRRLFLFAAPAIITTPGLLMAVKPLRSPSTVEIVTVALKKLSQDTPWGPVTLRDWRFIVRMVNIDTATRFTVPADPLRPIISAPPSRT